MPQSRQLAAIMFTDIVGYTALMGNDKQKAFNLLNAGTSICIDFGAKGIGAFLWELPFAFSGRLTGKRMFGQATNIGKKNSWNKRPRVSVD